MDDGVYKPFNSNTGSDQEQNNQVFPPLSL